MRFLLALLTASASFAQTPNLDQLKKDAIVNIDGRSKMVQEIVDSVFSFGELGFQEVETSKYLTAILEKNGFQIERGVAGIPTAWVATWRYKSMVCRQGVRLLNANFTFSMRWGIIALLVQCLPSTNPRSYVLPAI